MPTRKTSTRKRSSAKTSRKTSRYSEKAKAGLSRHIRKHRKQGMPQKQAVAAAMSEQRRKGRKVPARRAASTRKAKR